MTLSSHNYSWAKSTQNSTAGSSFLCPPMLLFTECDIFGVKIILLVCLEWSPLQELPNIQGPIPGTLSAWNRLSIMTDGAVYSGQPMMESVLNHTVVTSTCMTLNWTAFKIYIKNTIRLLQLWKDLNGWVKVEIRVNESMSGPCSISISIWEVV